MPDIKVPVRNFLKIKRLEDDPDRDGGILLVGTFVQSVLNENGELPPLNGDDDTTSKYFNYRFNDYKDDDNLTFRRTQDVPIEDEKENGSVVWRTTLQTRIPLKLDVEKEIFPFKLITATAEIELSSFSDEKQIIRPNIVLAREDFQLNASILEPKGGFRDYRDVDATLDDMGKLDLLSPYPTICYEYDKKKGYCPKYSVTFDLRIDGGVKFVGILLPLILVSVLNTLYLRNDLYLRDEMKEPEPDVKDLLEFSATLGLTVVFLFGNIYDPLDSKAGLQDTLYIIFIFISLILSSIPDSFNWRKAGVALFWISFVFPVSSYLRIWWLVHKKKPGKGSEKFFLEDKHCKDFSNDVFITLEPDPDDPKKLKEGIEQDLTKSKYTVKEEKKKYFISYGQIKRISLLDF